MPGFTQRFAIQKVLLLEVDLRQMLRALLDLHTAVWSAVAGAADPSPHTVPGRWVPHVTLARGIPAEEVATALGTLGRERGGVPELVGEAVSLRRWDSDSRRAWTV